MKVRLIRFEARKIKFCEHLTRESELLCILHCPKMTWQSRRLSPNCKNSKAINKQFIQLNLCEPIKFMELMTCAKTRQQKYLAEVCPSLDIIKNESKQLDSKWNYQMIGIIGYHQRTNVNQKIYRQIVNGISCIKHKI